MDPELIRLIEENQPMTLHGDIEYFAYLVEEREREACARLCESDGSLWGGRYAKAIRARGGDA